MYACVHICTYVHVQKESTHTHAYTHILFIHIHYVSVLCTWTNGHNIYAYTSTTTPSTALYCVMYSTAAISGSHGLNDLELRTTHLSMVDEVDPKPNVSFLQNVLPR